MNVVSWVLVKAGNEGQPTLRATENTSSEVFVEDGDNPMILTLSLMGTMTSESVTPLGTVLIILSRREVQVFSKVSPCVSLCDSI